MALEKILHKKPYIYAAISLIVNFYLLYSMCYRYISFIKLSPLGCFSY